MANTSFGIIATKRWTISLIRKVLEKMGATKKELITRAIDVKKSTGKDQLTSTYTAVHDCLVLAFHTASNSGKAGDCYTSAVTNYTCDGELITEFRKDYPADYSSYFNARLYRLEKGRSISVTGQSTAANSNCIPLTGIMMIQEFGYVDLEYEIVEADRKSNTTVSSYTHSIDDNDAYMIQLVVAGGGGANPSGLSITCDNPDRDFYGNDAYCYVGPTCSSQGIASVPGGGNNGFIGMALYDISNKDYEGETLTINNVLTSSSSTYHARMTLVAKYK